ncbi:bifunctional (p)ppGpp synthetase/guanosine-3',5'-bis(diphosphate) 3'-pyrophosphohydrolase [Fulvimonas sp. R45]|uniref:RelA/SpoT family protein n=1 Tax=Fulvimonas sp. R45 TaxID=3045937 RepID=UPI00265E3293|nr:bifunctional (p)ppGpp synthetase/guanosine-3',5'-bis(diphosphate) 3'-pyrophosphohydrolase [Fulvimonas sp. R45]MDO1528108.1 bifunctional (p)ppGpp synthetase/guanosine-3',5'-bis(diphosphate) 3'-pyrophosphohydrolase [Fulvimonas sp. R45]
MVQSTSSSVAPGTDWRTRVGPSPLLAEALDALAARAVDEAACRDLLELLADLGCDAPTLAAAAWFELARLDPAAWERRAPQLPEDLRRLVEGQLAAEKVWALHAQRGPGGGSEGLRRLLLAIIRDLRVVFVLLARQLARMRAATALPEAERQALARLTRDIHAPLANRLGIWQLKWELEDLAFRYLQPETYKRIAKLLDERRADREAFIRESLDELGRALAAAGITAELAGRPKHIYSIWKKMQRKELEFSELYDIRAVRVLVDSVADCYAALGVVHALWPHLPREFDDYLARPKGNGYRSLHTAVIGPRGKTLEVQIRTHEMHRANELGVAAHWRYKEGGGADAEFEAKIAWMRQLLDTRGGDEGALAAELRTELIEDRVYLLTPKGEVFDLPHGATVLDFAYHVHTEVGHRCRGAKVNGRIVPLTFQPASGDRVEILTAKLAEPSRDWLSPHHGYLSTGRAREKVRAWFRRSAQEANLAAGRAIFERELRRLALPEADLARLPSHFHLKNHDELLVALALGEVTPGQIARVLQEAAQPLPEVTQSSAPVASRHSALDQGALSIEGVGNLLTSLARCCQPLPGDAVRGYITKGRGVSVHRADCASLARLAAREPDRVIEVNWGRAAAQAYEVDIELRGYERKGLQKDVASVVSNANVGIIASSSRLFTRTGEVEMRFTLRVRDFEQLSTLLDRLVALPNIVDARRVGGA